jgi:structural maintenance of chromosome 1
LRLKEELQSSQEVLDERTKIVDAAKKMALKVSKVLDQALKEIATWVSDQELLMGEISISARMMRLRSSRWSVLVCIVDVGSRKSSCPFLKEISGTFLWKR